MNGRNMIATLSQDGTTLVVTRRQPDGIKTTTLSRDKDKPWTDDDIANALALVGQAGRHMTPGQHNTTRRRSTRFGTLWTHVMFGPPTWWWPRLLREKDGTWMAGWLRAAFAVKFERPS